MTAYAALQGTGPMPTYFEAPLPQNMPLQSTYAYKEVKSDDIIDHIIDLEFVLCEPGEEDAAVGFCRDH